MLVTPRYGDGALTDLIPSVLGALGVDGGHRPARARAATACDRVAVLLVDGMGAELVRGRTDVAPFLAGLPERSMTAGFPSTTAASLGSLGTGLPPGEHGIVGYLLAIPDHQRLLNPLKWRLMGEGPKVDLLKELVPEQFQPAATAFERAAADGHHRHPGCADVPGRLGADQGGVARRRLSGPASRSATSSTGSCPRSRRATGRWCTPTTATST